MACFHMHHTHLRARALQVQILLLRILHGTLHRTPIIESVWASTAPARALLLACLGFSALPTMAQAVNTDAAAYAFATLAGYPSSGSVDGVGTLAQFYSPVGVAADNVGNIYAADTWNQTIRKMTPAGTVSTIAGLAGVEGSADGVGSAARFRMPFGIAADAAGNLYVADTFNFTMRKLTPDGTNWVVSTIAGLAGVNGGEDGTNNAARFCGPYFVVSDTNGILYVSDNFADSIRKVTPVGTNWVVTTITDVTGNAAYFFNPRGVGLDTEGNLYVTDGYAIQKVSPAGANWTVTAIAGSAGTPGSADGTNSSARFGYAMGIAVDTDGNLYVADSGNNNIRKVTPLGGSNWAVSTLAGLAGSYGSSDGTGTNALFNSPSGVTLDSAGNLYVADCNNHAIRKVTSVGVVSTLAGAHGSQGTANGTGAYARFGQPASVAVDSEGNIYVADTANSTIRKVTSAGVVSTLAGLPGSRGSADGAGNYARFHGPSGIAVDPAGNLYVADEINHTIRKVTPAGAVTTLAGLAGSLGSSDGTNSGARFNHPRGIAVGANGNLFVADVNNSTIRKITLEGTNWVVMTLAGSAGQLGSNDGAGSAARFRYPESVAVDSMGNLYVTDTYNHTVRKVTKSGLVTTLAGSAEFDGTDDGIGSAARFYEPRGVAVDNAGNVYVADTLNCAVRKLRPVGTNWLVSTIGGQPLTWHILNGCHVAAYFFSGGTGSADGAGSAARFNNPRGIAVDSAGNVYIADTVNNTIRKGVFTAYTAANPVTFTPPPMNGQLTVTLLPPEADGRWRFPWELGWRENGRTASNLATGNYPIEFRNVPGYFAVPSSMTVAVTNGGITSVTNQYYPTFGATGANAGSLTVNIVPNPPPGAGWRFLGEASYRSSGSMVSSLSPDTYFIEFAPVSGFSRPSTRAVQVFAGMSASISANYLLASAPPAGMALPFPVPTNHINDVTNHPFGFNGQLETDLGFGSGVAVQGNVVLTAAHLVFNDQTLSYVSRAWWFFQREADVFEPQPLAARGWYVLSGYAAQRTNDLQSGLYAPGQSTPQSRNSDVAALYFLSPVAGGGYAGYLPSDVVPNPWLTGSSWKMLVGYPVDGTQFGDASILPGRMYQTDPQPYPLSLATDPVANQQVYTAPWFLSYPGNSGGPLYVQFNGYYYPAGVYLGTLYNGVVPNASAVRAIDSNVASLITLAATLGDAGTNNTGGGVITLIADAGTLFAAGCFQIILGPPEALAAGAGWRIAQVTNNAFYSDKLATYALPPATNYTITFRANVPGFLAPSDRTLQVVANQTAVLMVNYTSLSPRAAVPTLSNGVVNLSFTAPSGQRYAIESSSNLVNWSSLVTNQTGTNGLLQFAVTNSAADRRGFYRARLVP